LTQAPFWHFQYWVPMGIGEGRVIVMVTVAPGVTLVILKAKKPWGKLAPGLPAQVSADWAIAAKPVTEPALVVKVTVPVPVAVATGCGHVLTVLG
jgi:hypothetical protein